MATIQEELVLVDRFSPTFARYNQMAAVASGQTTMAAAAATNYQSVLTGLDRRLISLNAQWQSAYQQQRQMVDAGVQSGAAFEQLDAKLDSLGATIRDLNNQYDMVEQQMREAQGAATGAAAAQGEYNAEMVAGKTAAGGLTGSLRGLLGMLISIQGVKAVLGLSDEMAQTSARLDRVNAQYGTTVDLNQMIYQSAQASRGAYQETAALVGKLGTLAPEAFKGPDELVAFAEQINKQYVLAGTSAQGAQAATMQLTQALSSGVLRGEELNSVLEQAPTIVHSIGDYLGVSIGEVRALAAEGKITSEVVKNAVFAAAEATNEAFDKMPVTWEQRWTMMKNSALQAIRPVLDGLGWMADNIEMIGPPLLGLGAAFGVFWIAANGATIAAGATTLLTTATNFLSIGFGVLTGNTAAASAAVFTFNSALMASPVTWVAGGILLLTGVLYGGVAAYNALTDSSVSATGIITGAMGGLFAFVGNGFVFLWNTIGYGATFLENVFVHPVEVVKLLFLGLAESVLGYMGEMAQGIQDTINKIPGVEVDLTSGINSRLADVQSRSQSIMQNTQWKEYDPIEYMSISGMASKGYQWGANLFGGNQAAAPGVDWAQLAEEANANLSSIAGDVSGIQKTTSLADEDLRSLVDMAERRYVNNINLSTQAPVIQVQGQNTGNSAADRRALADTIKDLLSEQRASQSLRSTARVQ